jgi:hypothetical protein
MKGIFAAQLLPEIAKLTPEDAPRRAGLIATQVLGMALCRFVLRIPPIVEMTRTELIDWLGPTLQRYVDEQRSISRASRVRTATARSSPSARG